MNNQDFSKCKPRSWPELDRLYTFCRRQLHLKPDWRYGPARVHEVAKEGFDGISKYTSLQNKVYCDLGCGTYHPYGISAVMFLNGASSTISIDLHGCNKIRPHFERAGFEILRYENRIGEMPAGFMKQVAGRFRDDGR